MLKIKKIIEKVQKNQAKVLVVGDVMLDRYWFGDVNRISPEAPIPIAKINTIDDRPGGAANVARNIASLNGNVTLLSVVGNDEASLILESLLNKERINLILKKDNLIKTIVKLRIIAKNQQLIRIDFEEQPSHEILAEVLDTYKKIISEHDVVILSDYGKGGLDHASKMIEIANKLKKPILIDPKGDDYSKYKYATLITPNKLELKTVCGSWKTEADLIKKATTLRKKLKLKYLLLTRSEEGMTLFANKIINYQAHNKEVYDVSGAGDTVIATLGVLIANKITINEAIQIANIAAGVVIGKIGTATVTFEEIAFNS